MTSQGKVAVFGATGSIGQMTVKRLLETNFDVHVFARDTGRSRQLLPEVSSHIEWRYRENGWKEHIDGTEAVVNLSGAPIFRKWKGDYKKEIVGSRVEATRQISDAICRASNKPSIFVNGSAAGFYGYDSWDNTEITEETPAGSDFWGTFVKDWEDSSLAAETCGARVVNIRTSVVLSRNSGALPQLVSIFNKGIGGTIRPGNQWFPWIHFEDEVGLIMFALENNKARGPINASAPEVPTMKEFSTTLGEVLGKPSRLAIPMTLIKLMMGEVSSVLANGKRVVPQRAMELGYQFKYPELGKALQDLLRRKA